MRRFMSVPKAGMGIEDVLEQIVKLVPPPQGGIEMPLQALIIDSWFDNHRNCVFSACIVKVCCKKDKDFGEVYWPRLPRSMVLAYSL